MCNSNNLRYSYLLFAGRAWCFCQGCFHRGKVLWRTRAAMETKCRPIHRQLWLFPYTEHARRNQQQRQVKKLSAELQARGSSTRDLYINFKILHYLLYHRPPTKFRKGNVFTRVCHSVQGAREGSHVTIIHDALDLTIQGPQDNGLEYTGTLQPNPASSLNMGHVQVHYEVHMVCTCAVRILLECLLCLQIFLLVM